MLPALPPALPRTAAIAAGPLTAEAFVFGAAPPMVAAAIPDAGVTLVADDGATLLQGAGQSAGLGTAAAAFAAGQGGTWVDLHLDPAAGIAAAAAGASGTGGASSASSASSASHAASGGTVLSTVPGLHDPWFA